MHAKKRPLAVLGFQDRLYLCMVCLPQEKEKAKQWAPLIVKGPGQDLEESLLTTNHQTCHNTGIGIRT